MPRSRRRSCPKIPRSRAGTARARLGAWPPRRTGRQLPGSTTCPPSIGAAPPRFDESLTMKATCLDRRRRRPPPKRTTFSFRGTGPPRHPRSDLCCCTRRRKCRWTARCDRRRRRCVAEPGTPRSQRPGSSRSNPLLFLGADGGSCNGQAANGQSQQWGRNVGFVYVSRLKDTKLHL